MWNEIFKSILENEAAGVFSFSSFAICTLSSLVLGAVIACLYKYKNTYSKSFVITLALLPVIVQVVISLVNGNLGAGVAVMGAFSLVRFRSAPGSAKEICSIFMAMAAGLATGMGYIALAVLFVLVVGTVNLIYTASRFGEMPKAAKELKITIPESLDYTSVFDDLFEKYTASNELRQVKTCNMGSLYKLHYKVVLKDVKKEKEFIDELRCRNGNLEIVLSRASNNIKEEM